jgi:hypothetical protein
MDEGRERDRRGTFWDWPVGVMLAAVVLAVFTDAWVLAAVVLCFGAVALLVRRGAFSPRRR